MTMSLFFWLLIYTQCGFLNKLTKLLLCCPPVGNAILGDGGQTENSPLSPSCHISQRWRNFSHHFYYFMCRFALLVNTSPITFIQACVTGSMRKLYTTMLTVEHLVIITGESTFITQVYTGKSRRIIFKSRRIILITNGSLIAHRYKRI